MQVKTDIGSRINKIMGSTPRDEFASKLGVDKSTVQRYLKGDIPKGDVLLRIREVYGVDLNWLLTGDGEPYIKDHIDEHRTADAEGLWGKTEHIKLEGQEYSVTTYSPNQGVCVMKSEKVDVEPGDLFLKAITGLRDIFGVGNDTLKAAIMANIEAFKLSSTISKQVDEITVRMDRIEKTIKVLLDQHKPPEGVEERRKAFIELRKVLN